MLVKAKQRKLRQFYKIHKIKSRRFVQYLGRVFNKTMIPLALVGYEMIIANSALLASLAIYIYIYIYIYIIYMIIIAFFSGAPTQNRTSECPLHYNLIGDDCYFFSSIKLTWKEAHEVCKRESNGDLITAHSPPEQGKIVAAQNNLYRNVGSYIIARSLKFR